MLTGWREAMATALYGPTGYFTAGPGSAGFRTSANSSDAFAVAVLRLVQALDDALGRPDPLTVVDIGAGRGALLGALHRLAPGPLRARLRPIAVEVAPRPPDAPAVLEWTSTWPTRVTGLVLATEWLDNVPLSIAEEGRYVLVDPASGAEAPGPPLDPADAAWAERWWPDGRRVELGGPRDEAWTQAVEMLHCGLALTVDYGHTRDARPLLGSLTGFAAGRQVPPIPDGSTDLTAHVAIDAVRAAGEQVAGQPAVLTTQRAALTTLGPPAGRPPIDMADRDPAGYLRALAAASEAAELTEVSGLGGHSWLLQPVGVHLDLLDRMAR